MRQYIEGHHAAMQFFRGDPFCLATHEARIAELSTRFGRSEREAAAAALRPSSPRAAERLARFVEEGGAVVTTGQQTGLFTGPLYTVHKILGAITLADVLEKKLDKVVLPVFWSASEDHDWAEVNHAWMIDGGGRLRRLELPSDDLRPLPMSDRLVNAEIEVVFSDTRQTLQSKPYAGDYLTLLQSAYQPGTSVAAAFRETIEGIFAPFDLLTTDASDPALKRTSAPILRAALEGAAEHEAVLQRTSRKLAEAGYHTQVNLVSGAANVFLHTEAGRERLHTAPGGWRTRLSRQQISTSEIGRLLKEDPRRLSPNVFLRPIVESSVFPVVAYVGGPGEISYLGQISELFGCFGMSPPVVFPRPSVLFLPADIRTSVAKLGLEISDLSKPESELSTRIARSFMAPPTRDALAALRSSIVDGHRALLESVPGADPSLEHSVGALRNRALSDVAELERKLLRHTKHIQSEQLREVARARAVLRPQSAPQERVLNVFPFLAMYGPNLLRDTAAVMRDDLVGRLA
ncbi:MAG: bacillithiol biosynthesis cysteine-adding enzyme BshC [Gemmatimonadota bacterium]|nr:bacillithiol biosynthesis cysteine-adding enzyme BshC [Gemmatimonadota bacterium]